MCYVEGSEDHFTSTCPMCEIYKPVGRCRHKKDTCHNRELHPRFDVVFFKNAEVATFNGCGYCKWANTNPPPGKSGPYNPGWPGCCRPPTASELGLIPAADWRAVNYVHHTPIPPEVKAALKAIKDAEMATHNTLGKTAPLNIPSKTSTTATAVPRALSASAVRTVPGPIPIAKTRSTGSPKQPSSALNNSPRAAPSPLASGDKRSSLPDQTTPPRRSTDSTTTGFPSTAHRIPTAQVPSLTSSMAAMSVMSSKDPLEPQSVPPLRRRSSSSSTAILNPSSSAVHLPSEPISVLSDSSSSSDGGRPHNAPRRGSVDNGNNSDSAGSATDGTETSVGFTDYLSDESEAELQRQAEARAILAAERWAEETEFKAARQQLANVGLRPPKAWNTGRQAGTTVAISSRGE